MSVPLKVPAVGTASACNFVLVGSYYLLRPVRDAMASVFGVGELQHLFTGTLILTPPVLPRLCVAHRYVQALADAAGGFLASDH